MATFTYEAKDNVGRTVSGLIEAAAEREAASMLRDQGLFATRIAPMGGAARNGGGASPALPSPDGTAMGGSVGAPLRVDAAPFLVTVPLPELAMMYRQLATLMNAGVPIVQAVSTMAAQTRNGRLRNILNEGANHIAGGNTLSSVMERYPSVFSGIQVELVRAGETGGMLERMCLRLSEYLEREVEVRRKLKRETLYPKLVLGVAGLVILILGFVKAGARPDGGGLDASAGASAVGRQVLFAIEVGVVVFLGWWLARFLNQFPAFGAAWDRFKLLIPGLGGVSRAYATARFARALAALYSGGINIFRAVETAAKACGNRAVARQLLLNAPALQSGEGVSGMLARSGLLAPMAVQMARTGEQTGSMDIMMDKVADYLESEADTKAKQFATIGGVLLLIIAALVVAFIVISFYAGYFAQAFKETGS
jgi:type II secretory pathway component PulF